MKIDMKNNTYKSISMKKLTSKLFLLFSFVFMFASCTNLVFSDSDTNTFNASNNIKKAIVKVTINESLIFKTAKPDRTQFENLTYEVKAVKDGNYVNSTLLGSVYQMELSEGTWTVIVLGKKNNIVVVKGEQQVTVGTDGNYSLVIAPKYITEGTGTISLPITVPSGYKVKASCNGIAALSLEGGVEISSNTLSLNNVGAGNYTISLGIYKTVGSDEFLVYKTSQAVNVFANCTTNKWVQSSTTDLFIDANGNFNINTTNLQTVLDRNVYVSGTSGTLSPGNDTTGDGSYLHPYATIDKAMDKITAFHAGTDTNEYTIFVSGTVSLGETIELRPDGASENIKLKIAGYTNNETDNINCEASQNFYNSTVSNIYLTFQDIKVTGNSDSNNNVFLNIGQNSTIKLTNTKIVNSSLSSSCSVGIKVSSNSTVELENSTVDGLSTGSENNFTIKNSTINKSFSVGNNNTSTLINSSFGDITIGEHGTCTLSNITCRENEGLQTDGQISCKAGNLIADTIECSNFSLISNLTDDCTINNLITNATVSMPISINVKYLARYPTTIYNVNLNGLIQMAGGQISVYGCNLVVNGKIEYNGGQNVPIKLSALGPGNATYDSTPDENYQKSVLVLNKNSEYPDKFTSCLLQVNNPYSGFMAVETNYGTDISNITVDQNSDESRGYYLDFTSPGNVGKGILRKSGFTIKNNNYSYKVAYTGDGFIQSQTSGLGTGFYELDLTNNPTGSLAVTVSRKDNDVTGSDYTDITSELINSPEANFTVALKYQDISLVTIDGSNSQTRGTLPYSLINSAGVMKNNYYTLEVSFIDKGVEHHSNSMVLIE